MDGVPEYRDICRKGYESGLITRIISATCCQLSGNHCLSEYMAFLCRKQRKKNKHQSTKKGNDMEFVGIEKQLFEELVRKFEYFEHRVMEICNRENDRTLHKWIDNQDVCRYLNISPRTLQTLRDNGTLPFSQINHKIFYKPEDVQGIVKKVEDRRKEALYRGRNI